MKKLRHVYCEFIVRFPATSLCISVYQLAALSVASTGSGIASTLQTATNIYDLCRYSAICVRKLCVSQNTSPTPDTVATELCTTDHCRQRRLQRYYLETPTIVVAVNGAFIRVICHACFPRRSQCILRHRKL